MALGQLVDGQWRSDWTEREADGSFQRMPTRFHRTIAADGTGDFPAAPGRYHLYISFGCPWAHRTALLWKLKGLETVIGLSVVDPVISPQGWAFAATKPGCTPDPLNGARYLSEVYLRADPRYTGRVTVPVLWDQQQQTIVNNESRQIIRFLNSEFNAWARRPDLDFYPVALREQIEAAQDAIYGPINNGVYRAGFAASQAAYERAVQELFGALDHWETVLSQQRYLCGDRPTLADWCLFTTLFRFDPAYYGLFKCNLRRLVDYPQLWAYCRDLYQQPGVSEVCRLDHVQQLYYAGLPELNPNGIIPAGPVLDYGEPHGRDRS